jgi:hypothetical protein
MSVEERTLGQSHSHYYLVPSKRLASLTVLALACVYVAAFVFTPSPVQADGHYFTICGFKNVTGLPCPGCGLTHSFCALGKGDIAGAFYFNQLGPLLYMLSLLVWVRAWLVLFGRATPAMALDRLAARIKVVKVSVIAFLLFGVGRIIYLLIYEPQVVRVSPLGRLLASLTG